MTRTHGSAAFACGSMLARSLGFDMAAEFVSHRREKLVGETLLLAGSKAGVERCGEDICRHSLFDGSLDRPATFTGILDKARISRQFRILCQRDRREVEEPRAYDAAASPDLGDIGQVELKALIPRQFFGGG